MFNRGYDIWVGVEPVACGRDYELIPVTRYAYWSRSYLPGTPSGTDMGDDIENVWSALGGKVLSQDKALQKKFVGRRCVKQCAKGMTMLGRPEDMTCADDCPPGTFADPTDHTQCIKDGTSQLIIAEDLGQYSQEDLKKM